MSGMVGVIAQDAGRYTLFTVSLTSLRTPANTRLDWAVGSDRIVGRNRIVEKALEVGAEWLMFIDDDHNFPGDLVLRLLGHEKPCVGALYMQRAIPFSPIAYSHKTDEGKYIPLMLNEYGPDDLVEVAAIGTGGLLIWSEILRALPEPWFEHGRASEDMMFCDAVYEAGLGPIYCDLGARMGHMSPASVWPSHDGEKWTVGFAVADGFNLQVPIDTEVEEAGLSEASA